MSIFLDTILAAEENFLVYRGDTLPLEIFFFEDEAKTIPYNDLADWMELKLTIRKNKNSLDSIVILKLGFGLTVTDNKLDILFTAAQMDLLIDNYYFDIEGTTDPTVGTVMAGRIKRENDVTR